MAKGFGKRTLLAYRINFFNNPERAELRSLLFIYGLSFLISLATIFVSILLSLSIEGLSPSLILLIPLIFSAWFGGVKAALFSLSLVSLGYFGYFYLFLPNISVKIAADANALIHIILLIGGGALLGVLIDKAKKVDEVSKYKKEALGFQKKLVRQEMINIQAQEEIRARDELLSMASHELKTPLTLVLLQIQNALHNIRNISLANFSVGRLLEMLESVEQQTHHLSRMISDMLNVSLITTGKLNLDIEETNLITIVKDVSKRLPQTMNLKDYPINLKIKDRDAVLGYWDKVRIEQAVINIISNAIKYGNNKAIDVEVKRSNNFAEFIVKDRGIGISKDAKNKIFNRFERGVSNKDYKGLGVGLYITSQIVKAHGGNIKVDSEENRGSTFKIELPIKKLEK